MVSTATSGWWHETGTWTGATVPGITTGTAVISNPHVVRVGATTVKTQDIEVYSRARLLVMYETTSVYFMGTTSTNISITCRGDFRVQKVNFQNIDKFDLYSDATCTITDSSFSDCNFNPIWDTCKLDFTNVDFHPLNDSSWHPRGKPSRVAYHNVNLNYTDWHIHLDTSSSFTLPTPPELFDQNRPPIISRTRVLGRDSGRSKHLGWDCKTFHIEGSIHGNENKHLIRELRRLSETSATFAFYHEQGIELVLLDYPKSPLVGGLSGHLWRYTLDMTEHQ